MGEDGINNLLILLVAIGVWCSMIGIVIWWDFMR